MFAINRKMVFCFLEVMRGQRDRQNRNPAIKPRLHQTVHDRLCDKIMAIDATIDHKSRSSYRAVSACCCKVACQKRKLERPWHIEHVYLIFRNDLLKAD